MDASPPEEMYHSFMTSGPTSANRRITGLLAVVIIKPCAVLALLLVETITLLWLLAKMRMTRIGSAVTSFVPFTGVRKNVSTGS